MTFVKGKQIMDVILIANECVDARIKSMKPGILCKLDTHKAFVHLNWNCDSGEDGIWSQMDKLD